ncbi:PAS domain S-box protein [Calothrix membranacea FACHB-236]|nr:PAS domain S-box protein [Calothrix membranacea FACHB-236]
MSHLPLLTILLIDDCAEDRVTYRRFLQHDSRYTYRILEFDTATAAMNWCQYEIPDVILLDFALPNGDGLEFIQQLREQLRNSQSAVIMVTGQGDETIAVQAMKSGAQDYLLKSQLTSTILHSAIHYAVEQLRLLRQLEQSREQQHLIAAIALRIRQSLKLEEILRITAKEVRQFLKADRVLVYQFQPDMSGTVVAESVLPGWTVSLGMEIQDTCFQEGAGAEYYQGKKRATNDIYQAGLTDCHLQLLEQFEVKANLAVPILVKDSLWGLLIAHQCSRTRNWEAMELELLDQLGVQLSLAIQQANAYQQLQTELTERKWIEAALQASEEKLKLTLDFAHIGYWERNFITNEISASDNAIRCFGYERNSINVTTEEWLSKIHPEDREWVQRQLKEAIANKTDYVVEYRVVWPDHSIHWISSTGRAIYDNNGLPLEMLGVLMDVSDRKQAEASLRHSEERYRCLTHATNQIVWITDAVGNPTSISPIWTEITGQPAAEIAQGGFWDYYHPDDCEPIAQAWNHAFTTKQKFEMEMRVRAKTGDYRTFWTRGVPVLNPDSSIREWVGICSDISERKQAEEKLRESEERFRATFEQAAVGISHVSLSGQYMRLNQKFCDILGYTPAELLELTFQEITHPADLAADLHLTQKLLKGEIQTFFLEKRYITQDSSFLWVNLTVSLVRDRLGAPKYFISVIEDISHRKQMEAELQQNQERLNMALESAGMGNWDWNIQTGEIYWSPNLQRIFGMVPGSFNGNFETVVSMMHPDDRESVLQAINAAVYQKQEYHIEFRFFKANGTPRWALGNGKVFYDEQGNPTRMMGIDLDITERKQAEAIIKESEERFRHIADSSPVLMWISGTDKLCDYFNRSWLEFTGRTLEQELGNGWLEKVHPDDYQYCLETYVKAFDSRQKFQIEYRLQRFDGEYRWILDKGVPRFTSEGEFLGYMGSCIDISDRILAEQALQQLNQELETRVEQRTAALKESEERWQLALKGSNDGIWDWNLKTNQVFFSTRWKEMRGFTEDEMDSNIEEWWSRIHPDDYERFRTALDDHFAQKAPFFCEEYRVQHKNGSYIWVLNRGQALWDESGNVIRMSGATKDITERKLAEDELRKSQAHLSAAQRVARLGSWEFNLQTQEGWWSRETYEIYGRNPDEQPPSSLEENLQYIHPDDREYFTQKFHALLEERYQEIEYRLLRPDNTIAYILMRVEVIYDTDNQPTSIVGATLDITERKQAEAELLALSSLQQAILDGSDYAIISVNSQGWIQTFNSGAQKMLGYTAAEAINNTPELFHDLVEIQERSEILSRELGRPIASPIEFFSIKNQDGTYEDEWTYIHKNGDRFPVLLSATCLRKPDGEIWGFLGIAKDITQQKQMEAELRKNAAHLASAQQIAHLGSWEFDFQTQQIHWSAESFEIYGCDPQSGMPTYEELRQLIHPDDRDRHDHVVEQASQHGKSYEIEYRFYHSNGSLRYALARGEVILDAGGKPKQFIGTVQDITERKLAEEKLQSLSDRLSLALKAGAIGTWDWDIIHEIHWDERMYELYGIVPGSESVALYQEWLNVLHPDDRAPADAAFQALLRGEKEFDTEFRIIHADGSIRHIKAAALLQRNQQGEVQRAVGINYDITERKQIEAALRESERRYATLAEASPVTIFRIDAHGNCIYINERWSEMTCRPTESALGTGWLDAVHPEDREYIVMQRSKSLSKTPGLIRNEGRHLLPDGSITWFYAQLVPETNPDGNFIGYIGTLTDITTRKQIEAALWESERRYASLAEASPVAIFRLDAVGNCMYVNERWCEMTGRPAEEAMGYKWLNAVHPEDRHRFIGFSPSSTSENIRCDEGRHLLPDGSISWFYVQVISETDIEGNIIGYVGTLTDITARKEAEIALQESERRYATLAEASPVAIYQMDASDNIIYVNDRWSEMTGRPTEDAMGFKWFEAIHPDDRDRLQREWKQWLQTAQQGEVYHNEGRHLWPDGKITWFDCYLLPETNQAGTIIGYIGSLVDTTDRKATELALQESERRYANLAHTVPVAIFRFDSEINCIYVNNRWSQITGRPPEAAMGRKWLEAIHPEDRDLIRKEWAQWVQTYKPGEIFKNQGRHVWLDGRITWFDSYTLPETDSEGKIIGYIGTIVDITDRKEAEIALQESERRYATLAQAAPVGIYRFDAEGNCVYVNEIWSEMTGRPTEEALGKEWIKALHPDDREPILTATSKAVAQKSKKNSEGRHQKPDGSISWFYSQMVPEIDANGTLVGYIGTLTDITVRKEAEIALKESERRYATLTEAAPVGIFRFDAEGNCIYVNDRWSEMTGRPVDSALGMGWIDSLHPEDRDRISQEWDHGFDQGKFTQHEARYLRPDGTIIWHYCQAVPEISEDGSFIGYIGTLTNITAHKQAEIALKESERRYATLAEAVPVGIVRFDEQGNCIYVNERWCEMTGQPTQAALGMGYLDVLHPEDRDQLLSEWSQWTQLSQPRRLFQREGRYIRPDGNINWFSGYALAEINPDGIVVGYVGTLTDITERKHNEDKLRKLSDRLTLAVQSGGFGIWEWDIVNDVLFWDERMHELYGIQPSEFDGVYDTWIQRVHPDDRAAVEALSQRVLQGQIEYNTEFRVVHPDGSIRYIKAYALIKRNQQGEAIRMVGVNYDITERKLAELELIRNRDLREIIYNESTDAIFLVDPQTLLTIDCNRRAIELFAANHKTDLIGIAGHTLQHKPFSEDELAAIAVEMESKGFWSRELEYINHQGNSFWGNIASKPITVAGRRLNLVRITDISDRKQTEEILATYTRELADLYNHAPCGYHSLDVDGRFVNVNDTELQWLGYTYEEIIGQHFLDYITEASRPTFLANYPQFKERGWVKDLEFDMICKDGTILPVLLNATAVQSEDGTFISSRSSIFDIRDRKQAERELQESRTMLRLVLDTIPQRVFWKDCDSRYIGCNPSFASDYQLTPNEIIGKTDLELPWAEWAHLYRADDAFVINTKTAKLGYEEPTVNLNGEQIWLRTSKVPLTNSTGEVIGVLASYEDITERKQAEEQLQHTNHQLAHANVELARATRLKDEFLANMSHELRTPLNAILGMSEGLQEGVFGEVNERQIKAISTIERSGKHLLELINDILDLSKIESGKLELQLSDVPVRTLCDASISFIKQMALKKNIALSTRIAENLGNIYIDDRRLRQVLINLLSNAIKFTPEGGSVRLEVSLEAAGEQGSTGSEVAVVNSPPSPQICFSVIDTGIGINTEDISKLFQPFMQLDSSLNRLYNGTGLGLALVQRIATLHGGTVSVSSKVGEGSCFIVRIPYQTSDCLPKMQVTAPLPSHRLPADNSQVLIIEDSIPAAEQITRYLSEIGMQPIVYSRGEGSVEEALRVQPAFILLDLQLPNLSGWDVLNQLQNNPQTKEIPVIIISVVDERTKGLAQGAAEYIVKPITRQQFQATLEKLQYIPRNDSTALIVVPQPAVNPPLILLAEDNQANIDTMSGYLESRGYRLILAKNGQEALEVAKSQQPDLIVMDVQMPVMDGLEAMRHLRQERQFDHVPIIALTALAMPGDRENCLDAGANEYLSKPIKLKQLAVTIQQLLGR